MRNRKYFFTILMAVLVLVTAALSTYGVKADTNQNHIAEKILRFHVRANSNSEQDQNLKLMVRDEIGTYMSTKLKSADNMAECYEIVQENLGGIVETARAVIAQEGYDYSVEAYLKEVDFPVKTYGSYTFPAGSYQALEVVIGAGMGHNWWCVMYPNMCFSGSTYEVVDEQSKEKLEKQLTATEYESLMENKDYKISFKYLKFLNKYIN